VSLRSNKGGLTLEQDVEITSGSFTKHINYRVAISWAGRSVTLETDAVPGKKATAGLIEGASRGSLNLQIIIDGTSNDMNAPTVAGVYSDSLTVQIGQAL
jgi:hypothetical protein